MGDLTSIVVERCTFCRGGRRDVTALVALGDQFVCAPCVATAAEALIDHYWPTNPFVAPPVVKARP